MNTGNYHIYYKGQKIIERCTYKTSYWFKLMGLIGKHSVLPEEAIFLSPCGAIHTCFLNFNIDAVFIDDNCKVLKCCSGVEPWQFLFGVSHAYGVLEMCNGVIERFQIKEKESLLFVAEGEAPPETQEAQASALEIDKIRIEINKFNKR